MADTGIVATARCGGCGLPLVAVLVPDGLNTNAAANPHYCCGQLQPPVILEIRHTEAPAPEELWECCADAGIGCPACLTGRHRECRDCAQYDAPDEDDDDEEGDDEEQ